MNKLTSEVLFNRALLWLLIGWEESRGGENKWMAFSFFLLAAYNFWKSYKAQGMGVGHMSDFITNAELRIEAERLCDENDRLKAENAYLLELINILAFCTNDEAHGCDKCAINGAEMHATVPEWLFCDSLIERLRALGVEVSE